ncbi:MAG: STAS domain-containing protein [Gemmataceae bacterium]
MSTEAHPDLVEVTRIDGVTVVRFVRRTILDPATVEVLGDRLLSLIREEDGRRLVLDFARVESLPSAMLGKFAALQTKIAEAGGKVVCCNVGDFLRQIFTICHFPDSIPIHADEEAAVKALTQA